MHEQRIDLVGYGVGHILYILPRYYIIIKYNTKQPKLLVFEEMKQCKMQINKGNNYRDMGKTIRYNKQGEAKINLKNHDKKTNYRYSHIKRDRS